LKKISVRIFLLFIFLSVIVMLSGCGLPEIISLPKPSKVNTESLGLNSSVLAFRTPADITNIQGYVLSYKVYYSQTDFDKEEDESKWFYENYYINENDEMQPGPVICDQRGYIRTGELYSDSDSYPSFQIVNPPVSATIIYIDFDSVLNRLVMSDESPNPIVGFEYPITTVRNTLVRGVIDPTSNDNSFRLFTADWDFEDGTSGDNFNDADLRRKYNKPQSITTPLTTTDFYMSGSSFWDIAIQNPTQLIIGFVVYSYGFDPSKFQNLYSKPVFIGAVGYSPLYDTTTRDVIRP